MKVCTKCLDEKNQIDFHKGSAWCKLCIKKYQAIYRKNKLISKEEKERRLKYQREWRKHNPEKLKKYCINSKLKRKATRANYYQKNKEAINQKRKEYYLNNKDKENIKQKEYILKNPKKVCESKNKSYNKRMKNDIKFRLRKRISSAIRNNLVRNNSSKFGKSCFEKLNYTVEEFKIYLENQFEEWMSWENYGSYKKEIWDDEDKSTWTWQIDHIIPQSKLPYDSMDHPNFKKCWALDNLRPLASKINLLDGVNGRR